MDSTFYKWHPGTAIVARPWPFRPKLLPDELLSSWLIRTAHANGCDIMTLTGLIWPGWRVWTRDVDRHCPPRYLNELSTTCDVDPHAFEKATLSPVSASICGHLLPEKQLWPWILPIGARNRLRTGGLQYCPACLAEDSPHYRIGWRLAWNTACPKHEYLLHDRCHHCSLPIEPHRLEPIKNISCCTYCESNLKDAPTVKVNADSMSFQSQADMVAITGSGLFGKDSIPAPDWFSLAWFMSSYISMAVKRRSKSMIQALENIGISNLLVPESLHSIEFARTDERHYLFQAVDKCIKMGKQCFIDALVVAGTTSNSFMNGKSTNSLAVLEIANALPSASRGHRHESDSISINHPNPRYVVEKRRIRLLQRIKAASNE